MYLKFIYHTNCIVTIMFGMIMDQSFVATHLGQLLLALLYINTMVYN